ncbi:MAG TPA: beta-ketoacyl-[acyl-carrier-protein] synthase family protein, partial [Ktedonobacteraceae bacterium]|nr:beta-ketoacyl-[acyl-carrier-protein] synthase family protein [Ktedonobacteraceae bacterium]
VAPNGIGKEDFWQACVSGRSGVRHITLFDANFLPTRIAGEVVGFNPVSLGLTKDEARTLDRGTQFAVAAANLAYCDSGLPGELSESERDTMGVMIGHAIASANEGERLWLQFTDRGTKPIQASKNDFQPATYLTSFTPSSAISAHHQLHGPSLVISTGCSAGTDAIGQAFWAIQEGRADRMLAGGSDSAINASGVNVFSVMKALSTRNDDPERASRPYDGQRDGFVTAEGAGVLLLEERNLALERGTHIYAELISFTTNSNGHHMTTLPEDGVPLQFLLRQALDEANITPDRLDYINSHGSSTRANELAETAAYKAVFGKQAYHIPISSIKSMIGHSQGAAGAIETIVTALVLDRQCIPPTINQHHPDPTCDLDYVANVARNGDVRVALTHSSGFGGVNTALVLVHSDWMVR